MNDNLDKLREAAQIAIEAIEQANTQMVKQEEENAQLRGQLVKRDKARISLRYPWIKWRR